MWNEMTMRSDDVRIKCLVTGNIYIRDLDRTFSTGEDTVSFNDYNRSKDLKDAVSKKWIQILDKVSNYQTQQTTAVVYEKPNDETIKNMAKEMATEMATKIVSEMTPKIISEILEKMPKSDIRYIQGQASETVEVSAPKKMQAVDIEEETFVRMKTDNIEEPDRVTDLSKQSEVKTISSDGIKSSLNKLKSLKKNGG
jgi:hypothetical protein